MKSWAAAVLAGMLLLSGCTGIEPWLKPYERDRLADPVMSFDRDPVATGYLVLVHVGRLASRGAAGSAGGGCGCN